MRKIIVYGSFVAMVIFCLILVSEIINDFRNRRWDGVNRFTLIVIDRNHPSIKVLSIDPETDQAIRINLPNDLEVTTVSGKGVWKAGSVAVLAAKNGLEWAADSVAYTLGIPYTAVREKIGIWDKISWWNLSRNANWRDADLEVIPYVSESYAPDGERVLSLTDRWQDKAGDLFYSSNLAKEELKVEVYNTTDVAGLAAGAAQVLENAGVKVNVVAQSDLIIKHCLVVSLPEMRSDLGLKWVLKYFKCDFKGQTGMDNKEVKLFVGNDYVKWLYGV